MSIVLVETLCQPLLTASSKGTAIMVRGADCWHGQPVNRDLGAGRISGASQVKHAVHPVKNAFATALLLVGFEMLRRARHIKWGSVRYAFPAFLTMVTIPLTYSIAYGAPNAAPTSCPQGFLSTDACFLPQLKHTALSSGEASLDPLHGTHADLISLCMVLSLIKACSKMCCCQQMLSLSNWCQKAGKETLPPVCLRNKP